MAMLDSRERLVWSRCDTRDFDAVVSGTRRQRFAHTDYRRFSSEKPGLATGLLSSRRTRRLARSAAGIPLPLKQTFLNAKIGGEVDSPTTSERNGPNASGPNHLASGCADSRIRTLGPLARQEGRWRVGMGGPSLGVEGQLAPK
jgi:hypothetical protein